MRCMKSFAVSMSMVMAVVAASGPAAVAQSGAKVAVEAVETLAQYLARTGAKAAKPAVTALEKACVENGPAMAKAARAAGGWKTMVRAVEEAGERGPELIKLMVRHGEKSVHFISRPGHLAIFIKHGDDAVEALLKHKGIAEELINSGGRPVVDALNALSPKSGRMLSNMSREAETAAAASNPAMLQVLKKYGDEAMKFVWDNKGALAVGTTMAAFLADPERFMRGGASLTGPVANATGQAGEKVAVKVAEVFPWNLFVLTCGALAGLVILPGAARRSFATRQPTIMP